MSGITASQSRHFATAVILRVCDFFELVSIGPGGWGYKSVGEINSSPFPQIFSSLPDFLAGPFVNV